MSNVSMNEMILLRCCLRTRSHEDYDLFLEMYNDVVVNNKIETNYKNVVEYIYNEDRDMINKLSDIEKALAYMIQNSNQSKSDNICDCETHLTKQPVQKPWWE